jgi:hypothetical protein
MKSDWPLTQKEVDVYRFLYYDQYKALKLKGLTSEEDIRWAMESALNSVDWTWDRFMDYKSIDFMQRLVFEYSHELVKQGLRTEPMTSNPEYRHYDPNYGALRLKDNSRSSDPDKEQN